MSTDLRARFDEAMMLIYKRARSEAGYNATRYLQMLHDSGGLPTALNLIHSDTPSEGFTALWERRRLDLTVESLVLQDEWRPLFSDEDLQAARDRLAKYPYPA